MNTLTPKNKEDIEFQKELIIKLNPEKFRLEIVLYNSVLTIEINTSNAQ
jgi:hypothetical protein